MTTPPRHAALAAAAAAACATCAAALAPVPARAAADPLTLAVQETLAHDSNVFRAPDGHGEVPHDWISTTSLIAAVDQPVGRQRLKLDAELDANRFRYQDQLDSTSHSLSARLDWATVGRLTGEVGASQSKQLYRFAQDNGQAVTDMANTRTTDQAFLRAHLGGVTRWTLDAGVGFDDRRFSALQFRTNDLHRWESSLGATLRDTPDLALSLSGRHTRGDYDVIGDTYSRNDLSLGVTWSPSGASTLVARGGVAREHHSAASQRDADTWTADVRWQWQPTGRMSLGLAFVRDNDTGSSEFELLNTTIVNTDARIRTALNVNADYEVAAKVRATASFGWTRRQLDGAYSLFGIPQSARGSDRLLTGAFGLDWRPTRALDLACHLARERRDTSGQTQGLTYAYSATVLSCSGQFAFQ